jgi:hypothetical protein
MKKIKYLPLNKNTENVSNYPKPAITTLAPWYKEIKLYTDGGNKLKLNNGVTNFTVKACVPFLDAMGAGYTFTLDEDVIVRWENGAPMFNWRSTRTMITFHDLEQSFGVPTPEGYYKQVIKFHNDVAVDTPPGYSLWCTHPVNRFDLPFQTISGFVDTDTYVNGILFPFFIREGWEGIIEAGTPICQIIPIKRDSWQSEVVKYDGDKIYTRLYKFLQTINRSYKTNFWARKSYK